MHFFTGIQPSPGKTQRRKVEDRRARAGFGYPVANKDAPEIAEARDFVGRRQKRGGINGNSRVYVRI